MLRLIASTHRTVFGVVALLFATAGVMLIRQAAGADSRSPKTALVKAETTTSSTARSPLAQSSGRVEAEVITIRPTGFEPTEITRPKGLFLLAIENRSGLQAMQLRLDRVGVARLLDFQMPRNKHDWSDGFDLPPGRYVLSDAYHPDWACSITITAR